MMKLRKLIVKEVKKSRFLEQFLDEMFGIIIICLQAFSFYVAAVASFSSTFLSSRSKDLHIFQAVILFVFMCLDI